MTTIQPPQCIGCKHLISIKYWTCEAFPGGIPEEILSWKWDHLNPFPDDKGIRFEPID